MHPLLQSHEPDHFYTNRICGSFEFDLLLARNLFHDLDDGPFCKASVEVFVELFPNSGRVPDLFGSGVLVVFPSQLVNTPRDVAAGGNL